MLIHPEATIISIVTKEYGLKTQKQRSCQKFELQLTNKKLDAEHHLQEIKRIRQHSIYLYTGTP